MAAAGAPVSHKRFTAFEELDQQLRLVAPAVAMAEVVLPPKGGLSGWFAGAQVVAQERQPLLDAYLVGLCRLTSATVEHEGTGIGLAIATACRGVVWRWFQGGAQAQTTATLELPAAQVYFVQVERLRLLMMAHAVEDAADAASGNKGSPSRGRRLHASEVIRPAAQGPLRDAATK